MAQRNLFRIVGSLAIVLCFNKSLAESSWGVSDLLKVYLNLELPQHFHIFGNLDLLEGITSGVYDWKNTRLKALLRLGDHWCLFWLFVYSKGF